MPTWWGGYFWGLPTAELAEIAALALIIMVALIIWFRR
jgi:hypothetical protein